LINSSRGGVVETEAVRDALAGRRLAGAVLDVWENEPSISAELLSLSTIGTAHIAGYSLDGKVNAVRMMYQAVCKHFNKTPVWEGWDNLPSPAAPRISLPEGADENEAILRAVVARSYDIELDDTQLRGILDYPAENRGSYFMKLRSGYRLRREFHATTVEVPSLRAHLRRTLSSMGFTVA
jgi:erythronate-4-phosphate dehydrogenase